MAVFALTGGIGAGKSTVAQFFARQDGVFVVDSDALAREAVMPGTPALAAIVAEFGAEMLGADGALNRSRLGQVIFADTDAKRRLEAILHPQIQALAAEKFAAIHARNSHAVIIYEIPLLVETAAASKFAGVIVLHADEQVRMRRLVEMRGLTRAEAKARLSAQVGEAARLRVADFIIRTDTAPAATFRSLAHLLPRLRLLAAKV
ncbi:MAG: dephospho-CoA kinase [Microbacteriaceae bacterium]|nr:dephospho-CoA kinase [Microbacteriaceae bacterium]